MARCLMFYICFNDIRNITDLLILMTNILLNDLHFNLFIKFSRILLFYNTLVTFNRSSKFVPALQLI